MTKLKIVKNPLVPCSSCGSLVPKKSHSGIGSRCKNCLRKEIVIKYNKPKFM
jgi:hypothetical protein